LHSTAGEARSPDVLTGGHAGGRYLPPRFGRRAGLAAALTRNPRPALNAAGAAGAKGDFGNLRRNSATRKSG
jgi:hypothetical protein